MRRLRSHAALDALTGMARFGIRPGKAYGISMPVLRRLAREIGTDHDLAQRLWDSGVHEARLLAALIDDPAQVTEGQLESWVRDFDNWAECDTCCGSLFDRTRFAYRKAAQWTRRREQYVKRAGFALMAWLVVHDKSSPDGKFEGFLAIIEREADDDRNFVKKAANWALRQIGKRNLRLNRKAIQVAEDIRRRDSRAARWIASDALRELTSEAVQTRLRAQKP